MRVLAQADPPHDVVEKRRIGRVEARFFEIRPDREFQLIAARLPLVIREQRRISAAIGIGPRTPDELAPAVTQPVQADNDLPGMGL